MKSYLLTTRFSGPILPVILLLLISTPHTGAQNMTGNEFHHGVVSLGLTSDAFGGSEMGYANDIPPLKEQSAFYYVRVSIPMILTLKSKKLHAWELKAGVKSELRTWGKVSMRGDIQLYVVNHQQVLGHFIPIGANIGLTPCYKFSEGYVGLQASWNQTFATHISYSQYARNSFQYMTDANNNIMDMHPNNGWYASTGSHLNIGIEGYRQISPRIAIYGDMGLTKYSALYSGVFDAMMIGQVPFYGNFRLYYKM